MLTLVIGCFGSMSDAISASTFSPSTFTDTLNVPGPFGPCIVSVQSPTNGAASAGVAARTCSPPDAGAASVTAGAAARPATRAQESKAVLIMMPPGGQLTGWLLSFSLLPSALTPTHLQRGTPPSGALLYGDIIGLVSCRLPRPA